VSIEVQCPNPDCAKVHRVKNRWAGKRGTCPDCGAVIRVPDPSAARPTPAEGAPRRADDPEAAAAREMAPQAMEFALPDYPALQAGGGEPEVTLAEEAAAEDFDWDQETEMNRLAPAKVADPVEEERAVAPAAGELFWVTALLYVLAVVGLLVVCAAPWLAPESQPSLDRARTPLLLGAAGAVALLVLAGLAVGFPRRQLGMASLRFTCPAALLGMGLLLLLSTTEVFRAAPRANAPGMDFYAALAGAAAAAVLLLVAVVVSLRQVWARSVFMALELFLLTFGILVRAVKQ
jgi:hypothetical protein